MALGRLAAGTRGAQSPERAPGRGGWEEVGSGRAPGRPLPARGARARFRCGGGSRDGGRFDCPPGKRRLAWGGFPSGGWTGSLLHRSGLSPLRL